MKQEIDLPTFDNAQAWIGRDMARREDWIHELNAAQIAEIDRAVQHAESTGRDMLDLRREDFPLDTLLPVLSAVRQEALAGRGFFLIRGIPVERYTLAQCAIAYWGVGLYLGEVVSQNGKGHVLGHVTNLGLDYADPQVRGYQTTVRLPYHCDLSDLVLLLCVKSSRSGGLSSVVSSTTLWNEMVRTRPDHARTLMEPVYFTRWNEIPEGRKPYSRVVPFVPWQGRMIGTYVRAAVVKGQQLPGVPPLTQAQMEAMDYLDSLAADPDLHLDMAFRPGDIQVLCNYFTFHSRTSYEDWPERERRRHLMRLWLACDDGPALPPFITQELQCATAGGRPNGIRVPGTRLVAPVEP
jgi:hypothetical protein